MEKKTGYEKRGPWGIHKLVFVWRGGRVRVLGKRKKWCIKVERESILHSYYSSLVGSYICGKFYSTDRHFCLSLQKDFVASVGLDTHPHHWAALIQLATCQTSPCNSYQILAKAVQWAVSGGPSRWTHKCARPARLPCHSPQHTHQQMTRDGKLVLIGGCPLCLTDLHQWCGMSDE